MRNVWNLHLLVWGLAFVPIKLGLWAPSQSRSSTAPEGVEPPRAHPCTLPGTTVALVTVSSTLTGSPFP